MSHEDNVGLDEQYLLPILKSIVDAKWNKLPGIEIPQALVEKSSTLYLFMSEFRRKRKREKRARKNRAKEIRTKRAMNLARHITFSGRSVDRVHDHQLWAEYLSPRDLFPYEYFY